ncbi:hypothetical protein [Bifidobacterium moukalabense]|uniref:hypothetical protein n=1 Tax=Bifidobacterium moukalabense TaxID=1333651 RepID=UPI0010F582F5|nr:hypothetical protein [Bifidobacterium moukalabense]
MKIHRIRPNDTRPRRWRRPVPCPICGSRNIQFRQYGKTFNPFELRVRQVWACICPKRHGICIITSHADLKEAIRAWNTEASKRKDRKKARP